MVKVVTINGKTFEFKYKLERFAVNNQSGLLKIEVDGGNKYYFPLKNVEYFVSSDTNPFWEKM